MERLFYVLFVVLQVAMLFLVSPAVGCGDRVDNQLTAPYLLSGAHNLQLQHKTNSTHLTIVLSGSATVIQNGYMAFGLPEQASGSMLGADIVTVNVGASGQLTVEDRHVPFVAWPFAPYNSYLQYNTSFNVSTSPSLFPKRDCENGGTNDWVGVSSLRNATCIHAKLTRRLVTTDTNDMEVPIGQAKFLWAVGGTDGAITYHGANRGVDSATFRSGSGAYSYAGCSGGCFSVDYLFSNYTIPHDKVTHYSCQSYQFNDTRTEIDGGNQIMAVEFEPIIAPGMKPYVHHFVVFGCPGNSPTINPTFKTPNDCNGNTPPNCFNMLWAWGIGGGKMTLPDSAGFPIGNRFANQSHGWWIQIHYTNPLLLPGLVDSSGVRITYTTVNRANAAGALLLGLQGLLWDPLPGGKVSLHRQVTCPTGCTLAMKQDISVFGSFLHMHTFGQKIWTSIYDRNGTFKRYSNRIDFWNIENQEVTKVNYQIVRGDRLQTHCVYDTSKWNFGEDVTFNEESFDEMCLEILFYYPAQYHPNPSYNNRPFFNCGAYWNSSTSWGNTPDFKTYTECTNEKIPPWIIEAAYVGNYLPATAVPSDFLQVNDSPSVVGANKDVTYLSHSGGGGCAAPPAPGTGPSSDGNYSFSVPIIDSNLFWKVQPANRVKFKHTTSALGWLAFGIAGTGLNKMIGAYVVIAENTGPCKLRRITSFTPSEWEIIPLTGDVNCTIETDGVTHLTIYFEGASIGSASFIPPTPSGRRQLAEANVEMIVASSPSLPFSQHVGRQAFTLDLYAGTLSVDSTKLNARRAHGLIMAVVFAIVIPFAIMMPAYFKPRSNGSKTWLNVHATLMFLSSIAAFVGLILIENVTDKHLDSTHKVLGVIALALVGFQPLNGMLRPHVDKSTPKTNARIVWEYVHRFSGRACFVTALVNCYIGANQYSASHLGWNAVLFYILCGIPAILFAVAYFLSKFVLVVKIADNNDPASVQDKLEAANPKYS